MDWTGGLIAKRSGSHSVVSRSPARAVYNHWTGLVDWTGGLDWWTDTKNHFYASNETYSPVGLHDASY